MEIEFINKEANKYFDYTASGLCIENIESEMREIMANYANTHSKDASLSSYMNDQWYAARKSLFATLDISKEFEIIPTGFGATGAIKRFQELVGIYMPPRTKQRCEYTVIDKPLVLIGPYEHHSNDLSYRESIADTERLELDNDGNICMDCLETKLKENKKREIYVCVAVASNVTGIITDVEAVSKLCRRYNARLCLDAATSSPYMNVPSDLYDVMFMSPHKALGGPGTVGLLVIKKDLIDMDLPPTFAGGGTVCYVNSETQNYLLDYHDRENAGTPGILQFIRTSKVYEFRNLCGLSKIKLIKRRLHNHLVTELKKIQGVTIYGNMETENIGICSINVDGFSPYDLCKTLSDDYGIQTRAGCSCAGPYGHVLLSLPNDPSQDSTELGWLRFSIHFTHTKEDVDYLLKSLKEII